MRGVLAPLTNVLGRRRPRSLSPSSSDSDVHSDGDEGIQPVGARIGHNYNPRPMYDERVKFNYNLELADGTTRTEQEIAVEQLRASGLRPESLVLRRSYWAVKEGCMKYKYACAMERTCGCKYYVFVNFKRTTGTIVEPINNVHNNHERTNPTASARVHATAEQKALINTCIRDGVMPFQIQQRLREEGLDANMSLGYLQRYKSNHKSQVLGQDGFLGTMGEYEELFDAFPVENAATPGTAGVVDYFLDHENGTIRCIVSSKVLLDRLSTEIVPGVLGWCVDGTYKLNREGHVTIPIGVFDMHRKFYFCAFAIVPGPGENTDDFEWLTEKLEEYISRPGLETRRFRRSVHLVSDSSAGLVSGITRGMHERDVFSQLCGFHFTKDIIDQIANKLCDRDRHTDIIDELRFLRDIPYPLDDFYYIAFDAWVRRWESREPEVVQYMRSTWRNKHWSCCFSRPGFPLTNNGIESKNGKIKDAFRRSKMNIRDSIRVLSGLLESEVTDFAPEYDTSLPELSRIDFVKTDTYMRNHINSHPLHRIEIDHERTLYPTRAFRSEIDNVLKMSDSNDEDRARQKERITRERVKVFLTFYERTMIGGRAPAANEPTHKFEVMRSLAQAFHVVTKLPPSQCSDTVLYSCTCVRTTRNPQDCSYGKHRKCRHVFVEGWKRGTLLERQGFTRVHERVAPGRPARMLPALVRETPAAVVNQYATWGLPVPEDA